ncbi:hypothetical protein C8F04DRAFT_1194689 [Mycena alexandri]|uniref:Uncharacterized protein n=1 Tax=Mycena alexandri TaxID=1745969 RepID=A0AAD6S7U4_9AGAR|nr:hypothetical protein C8F04DRAFT_1194689 [Mycena alexandri]
MSLSYPPVPYAPLSSPSASPHVIRLLNPMPIPRTPNAPYFDERGVRAFLTLILQHGSCAGITNADELVSFIVRYSSDRVRAVIQYIPELDEDMPSRTWSAAEQQMLLLYGSSDEERRVSEQELLEFCRERSAKPPFRSKLEVELYLRSFQYIAAPLLRQQDITIAQRDYYFVSGIPCAIKNWFILRVPESQTDTLGILYGYFDPDELFPDLWDALGNFSEPAESLTSSIEHPSSTSSLLEFELPAVPERKRVHWDLDNADRPDQDFTVDEQFKVSPSDDELAQDTVKSTHREHEPDFVEHIYKGSTLDSYEEYPITDRVSGFYWALGELKHLATRQDVDQVSVADIARSIQAELEQCLTSASCGYVGLQISPHSSFIDNDSGSVSEIVMDITKPTDPWTTSSEIDDDYERYLAGQYDNIELSLSDTSEVSDSCDITVSDSSSVFDSVTDFEADFSLSSCSEPDDTDQSFEPGMNFRKSLFLSDVQFPEFTEQCRYMETIAIFDSEPSALSYSLSYATSDAAFDPDTDSPKPTDAQQPDESESDLAAICDLYTSFEHTQLSIPPSCSSSNSYSGPESITELFLKFCTEQKSSELSAVVIINEQDLNTIYVPAETNELSYIPLCTPLSAHSEFESITDSCIEFLLSEQEFTKLKVTSIASASYTTPPTSHPIDEDDLNSIYDTYFEPLSIKLSPSPILTSSSISEPEFYRQRSPAPPIPTAKCLLASPIQVLPLTKQLTKICAPFLNFTLSY